MNQQMATPISNLPLKTAPPQDQGEIEDPLIQNVLKEFENDMRQQKETPEIPQYQPPPQQQYQAQQYQPQPQYTNQYRQQKKLVDMKLVKNAVIISIIVFLLQNFNIINMLLQKLPESVTKHIIGKEFMLNFALVFGVFYALMYFEFI